MSGPFEEISQALVTGSISEIERLTRHVLHEGTKPQVVLDEGLLPGMQIVGQRFKCGEMFIPEVLLAARTMQAAMGILRPLLARGASPASRAVVIGTVQGDIHSVGKDLVAMMLEGAGFRVVDLGVDVKVQAFVEAVKVHRPDILGMSALLTTTMPMMRETVDAVCRAGLRDQIKIMAGGAPVNRDFVVKIGADAYASNAVEAVEVARSLIQQ